MSLVYRDMTFCKFSDCADFDQCSRRLTESVKQAAELLRLPICQFAEQPNCFEAKKSPETGQD
jgi:hypothetical protein